MFDQMNLPVGVTVTDFERAMSEIEPGIEGESLQAGVILLVAASRAEIGQDVDALAAFTGYDRDLVQKVRDRLVRSRLGAMASRR